MEEILRAHLDAPESVLQNFLRYGERLKQTNAVTNLTAIRDDEGIARLHFLDSAALLALADFSGRDVVDVGTGAGFPGLPLRLLQPDMRLTLLDSNNKKIDFLQGVCTELAPDVRCLWAGPRSWASCARASTSPSAAPWRSWKCWRSCVCRWCGPAGCSSP